MPPSPPKKILFVRPTLGEGGADRVTLTLLREIDRSRYAPELALMRKEGPFLEGLPADVPVHDCRAPSLWFMVGPLVRILKEGGYDIVYSTCGGASIPLLIAAGIARPRATVVVSERNILFPPGKGYWKRRFMVGLKALLYPRADWVAAVSEGVRQEAVEMLKISPENVVVVHNPMVDAVLLKQKEEPVNHPFFDGAAPVILAVGRMVRQKDYPTLLRAFRRVRDQLPARLFILGRGPLLDTHRRLAEELGLGGDACFAGFDKNPFKYMARCDVFALSSRHEGMPGVLVQAMACGAACVSTDCPTGPNEVITGGEDGFLVPVGDPEALAARILELLRDDGLRRRFQQRAPLAVERFSVDSAVDSYFNFLDCHYSRV